LARLMTAPTPVVTAHPTSAATSVSVPAGRGMQERALTTAWRADGGREEEGCSPRPAPGEPKPPPGSGPAAVSPRAAPHNDRRPPWPAPPGPQARRPHPAPPPPADNPA